MERRQLDRHRGAGLLEGLLGLVGLLLVDLLQQRLGRAVDEVLGLLEAQAREGADLLDDLDLLVAGTLEDDAEPVPVLGLFGRGARGSAGGGDGDRRGGLDVEGLFVLLLELRQLEEGHLLERVEELVGAELRHVVSCSLAVGPLGGLVQRSVTTAGSTLVGCFGGRLCRRLATLALALGPEGLRQLRGLDRQGVEDGGGIAHRRLHRARELREENLARLEGGELGDLLGRQRLAVDDTALDYQIRVGLGEVTQALGGLDHVAADERDRRRTLEQLLQFVGAPGLASRGLGQRVLHHGEPCILTEGAAQLTELCHGEPAVLGQHGTARALERILELGDRCRLVRPRHGPPSRCTPVRKAQKNRKPRRRRTGLRRANASSLSSSPALATRCAGPSVTRAGDDRRSSADSRLRARRAYAKSRSTRDGRGGRVLARSADADAWPGQPALTLGLALGVGTPLSFIPSATWLWAGALIDTGVLKPV